MKNWQILTLSVLVTLVAVLLLGLLGMMVYTVKAISTEPMVVQVQQPEPQPVAITVEIPGLENLQAALEKLAVQPATVIPVVEAQPTPVAEPEETEEPEEKCQDAATLVIDTPYFKTWAESIEATITVWNVGNCFWEDGSHYIAPWSTPIPEVYPGGFATVQVVIPTTPGLSTIIPVVMSDYGAPMTPQALAEPLTEAQFDYAQPMNSVPQGAIVINYPTEDWRGLQYPEWKVYPGMGDDWFFLDGTGYKFPRSGCKGGT